MRKSIIYFLSAIMLFAVGCSESYDDSALVGRVDSLENRVAKLEELCKQMNTNISSLQSLVTAFQNNDYVTGVTPVTKNGESIGYTITFTKSQPITIYHGENGKDGQNGADGKDGVNGKDGTDGHTPVIGVKQDTDGIYYWTLDGDWLLDDNCNKIKAQGTDGKDGENGKDGQNGTDGKDGENGDDGITPQLKIENEYWYISYDNGSTWTKLGKATGDDGKEGDSFFQSVSQDKYNVYFTLADGTKITIPKIDNNQIEFLVSRIQSISYIPQYSDGNASIDKDKKIGVFDFQISPKDAVMDIEKAWDNILSMQAVYTQTRNTTFVQLPVKHFNADIINGIISIEIDATNLGDNFFSGKVTASAALNISDGNNSRISPYINLALGAVESIEKHIDLSEINTANCYIVSSAGKYMFNGSIIGNGDKGIISNANFHTNSTSITPYSVELVWDTNNIISELYLKNGFIYFTASSKEGNALIAVKDSKSNILWSWHIWATDTPKDFPNYDGYLTIDRNLGAISANYADGAQTYGLYYQWGRKDPLRNPSTVVDTDETTGCITYTIKHPTQLIGGDFYNWQYSNKSEYLWGYKHNTKTIYDPCPVGYKVPFPTKSSSAYVYESSKSGGRWDGNLWYPFAGRLDWETGAFCNKDIYGEKAEYGHCGFYYVNTYSNSSKNDTYDQYISSSRVLINNLQFKGFAESVRCIRE